MGFRYLAMRVQHDTVSRQCETVTARETRSKLKIYDLCMLIKVKNRPLILFEYTTLKPFLMTLHRLEEIRRIQQYTAID